VLSYSARSAAPPEAAWALISQPRQWYRWAPHLRGAVGLGRPEVQRGRVGFALLGGVIPVLGVITGKDAGRSWTWQVGLLQVRHMVLRRGAGCEVRMTLSAPWPLERTLAVSYGPLVALLVRRLARIAEA
jgi:hypothetical protein